MDLEEVLQESQQLSDKLTGLLNMPLCNDSPRVAIADTACSLALEYWDSVRLLLTGGLLPAALVVHRSQFEAILRSVWLTYAASDLDIAKLTAELNLESEQAAKNLSQTKQMMDDLAKSGPVEAHSALARFKSNSWNALNSYAHAGIHPLRRHAAGYPVALLHGVLCNANGLGVLAAMQAVVLSGAQPLQKRIIEMAAAHPACMPPPI